MVNVADAYFQVSSLDGDENINGGIKNDVTGDIYNLYALTVYADHIIIIIMTYMYTLHTV